MQENCSYYLATHTRPKEDIMSDRTPQGWGPPPSPQSQSGSEPPRPQPQPRKKRRVFMWVILAVNALFLVWFISGLTSGETCTGKTGDALTTCQAGQVGTGIGVFLILFIWALVDVILGVIYMVTRRR